MRLFRYMSAVALFDIIMNERLYFHPLHGFEDQWEGVPLEREREALRKFGERNHPKDDLMRGVYANLLDLGRSTIWASCWHEADDESMAMWKIYAGTSQGCCIVADKAKTISSLTAEPGLIHFPVQYVDRESHMGLEVELPATYHSAQFKDLAYRFESEYRFLLLGDIALTKTHMPDGSLVTQPDFLASQVRTGRYLRFVLPVALEQIILSPFLKKHEQDVIKQLIARLLGTSIKVDVSRLLVK